MDFRGLGRIYKGLAQSGSWGCFDEFNRIDVSVLSVVSSQVSYIIIASHFNLSKMIFGKQVYFLSSVSWSYIHSLQQVLTIRNALIHKLKRFQFEGTEISLDSRMGIFITMNPGYAGRTELPGSVKALFRWQNKDIL